MHNQSIFIISRYSIITAGVKLGDGLSLDDYKTRLFSDERLKNRLSVFSQITAKSIVAQTPCDANLHFALLISDELPLEHKKLLEQELSHIQNTSPITCSLIAIPSNASLRLHINQYLDKALKDKVSHPFATVRLDDDDGLSASYCSNLCKYLTKGFLGIPISFAYGYEGFFDENHSEFSNLRHWYYPKIALGLAFTNSYSENDGYFDQRKSVYGLGSHTNIDIKDPVLIDSRYPAYFRTVSAHNDSGGYLYHNDLEPVRTNELNVDEFPFIKKIVGHRAKPLSVEADKPNPSRKYPSSAAKYRHETQALKRTISSLSPQKEPTLQPAEETDMQ